MAVRGTFMPSVRAPASSRLEDGGGRKSAQPLGFERPLTSRATNSGLLVDVPTDATGIPRHYHTF
jgi:hypothetical protein